MRPKALKGIVCPGCNEFIPKEELPEETTQYQCSECDELYEDRETALKCCYVLT